MTDSPAATGSAKDRARHDGAVAADRGETSAPPANTMRNPATPSASTPVPPADPGASSPAPLSETEGQLAAARMLSVDARKVIALGTGAFLLAFLVLLPFYGWLGEHGHRIWLWTSLAGWLLGVAAFPLIRKHSGEGRLG